MDRIYISHELFDSSFDVLIGCFFLKGYLKTDAGCLVNLGVLLIWLLVWRMAVYNVFLKLIWIMYCIAESNPATFARSRSCCSRSTFSALNAFGYLRTPYVQFRYFVQEQKLQKNKRPLHRVYFVPIIQWILLFVALPNVLAIISAARCRCARAQFITFAIRRPFLSSHVHVVIDHVWLRYTLLCLFTRILQHRFLVYALFLRECPI